MAAAAAAVKFGFFRTQPEWTETDKEQLLGALWAAHERTRVVENARKCRYKCRRYAEDEQFRKAVNSQTFKDAAVSSSGGKVNWSLHPLIIW